MRILFLTDNFPPEVNAPATRTYEHCKEWVKNGVEVTVITCNPNFPQGVIYEGYRNGFLPKTEVVDGIKVVRVWSYIAKNSGFFKRVIDFISFAITSFWTGLFIKTDIVIATSPQFFTAVSGAMLSFFKRKPWIFELRDLWPDSIRSVTNLRTQWLLNLLESIELLLYKDSTKIVAVTNAFKKNLIGRGIKAEKIDVITNGCNLDLFDNTLNANKLKNSLGLSGKKVISYIGTHGLAHDLELYVTNADLLNNPEIVLLFIGDGATKNKLIKVKEEKGLKNVIFLDPVSKDQIPLYWAISDIALIPLKKDDTFKTVIPSKIFEASAMKKPILLGVDGQAREIVEEYNAGLFFEPGNFDDFKSKLNMILSEQNLYDRLSDNCAKLAQDYNRETLASRMLEIVKKIVN
jgi:glycosyltransferase involved in cell wall biosynthesis